MKKFLVFLILCKFSFAQINGAKYLIITHDNFYNQALTLAKWKHKKGVPSKVVKLSEIGSTYTAIKNYIVNAYNSWQIKPEYVLIFGAVEYVPTHPYGEQSPQYQGHDHYYSDITGDALPEIAVGRLPCRTTTEAEMMVQKILSFEKDVLLNPDWYIKGTTIVRRDYDPDDNIYLSDTRIVRNFWIQYGYTKIDSLRNDYGHNAQTVINCVNEGREFVVYRGTGVENWYSPFDVNPYNTANGKKLPIVVSGTCRTVAMVAGYEYAGEAWLRAGSVSNLTGAVAFLGTTTIVTNGAYLRSAFVRGFFKKIYRDSVYILGEALKAGKKQVYDSTGSVSEVRSWQLLGDPELNIWTKAPKSFIVNYQNPIQSPLQFE
ncbi:MAG: C25 family cysteine peptidase, partial [candidate division WOR-3 bacterium]